MFEFLFMRPVLKWGFIFRIKDHERGHFFSKESSSVRKKNISEAFSICILPKSGSFFSIFCLKKYTSEASFEKDDFLFGKKILSEGIL